MGGETGLRFGYARNFHLFDNSPVPELIMKIFAKCLLASACVLFAVGNSAAQTNPRQPPTGMSVPEYEATLMSLPTFSEIAANWVQKAPEGNVAFSTYELKSLKTWEPGEQKVFPKDGQVIAYIATGLAYDNPFQRPPEERISSKSTRIMAIDAQTKEILAWNELPVDLAGSIHGTPMSPDGKYLYLAGPVVTKLGVDPAQFPKFECDEATMDCANVPPDVGIPASVLKIDALTLEPVEAFMAPGRLHHGHVFRDKYMIFDNFTQERDGANIWIMDPATDTVIAATEEARLGGFPYTIWTNQDDSEIFLLMEPTGYVPLPQTGYFTSYWLKSKAGFTALKNFWVAKIDISEDLKTWTVEREYPYFGYRANWVEVAPDGDAIYVAPGSNSIAQKIDLETGQLIWSEPVGDSPYGTELTPDGKHLWVVGKGENTGNWGNDIMVLDTRLGRRIDKMETGYVTDHLVLTPNGKEIWATSNGSGKILVYDVDSHDMTYEIHLPGYGDAHGLPFVYYETADKGLVVADQHGFHNGYDAQRGKPLEYAVAPYQGETIVVKAGMATPGLIMDQAVVEVAAAQETEVAEVSVGQIFVEPHPDGDPVRGKEIYESDLGCNICHDMSAEGALGPNIRQVTMEQILYAFANFKDMQVFRMDFPEMADPQTLADVQSYLATLPREQ